MKKKFKSSFLIFFLLFLPILVFAATIVDAIDTILGIVNTFVIPTLVTLATVVFIWGIIQYILASGSDTRKKEAKNLIIWGLVGLFVIIAMWGIVKLIGATFSISEKTTPIINAPPLDITTKGSIEYILYVLKTIVKKTIPLLMIIATAVFIWGIISYVLAVGSDERKKEAKNLIIWGLVGLFVIAGMWGIVKVIEDTFGVTEEAIPVDILQLR